MSSSRWTPLLRSKITICLLLTFIVLIITLGIVLGLVTIPNFEHDSSTSDNSAAIQYAVIKQNFPDPCLIQPGSAGNYYAFATRNTKVNVQVASTPSTDISEWTYHDGHDALPYPAKWTATQLKDVQVWAPSVMEKIDGSFVMFYSALSRNHTQRHCIGAAVSEDIMGPYTPFDEPIVCDFHAGGVIDPSYFHDPAINASYLIYKQDGNSMGAGGVCGNGDWPNTPTPLMAVELAEDLTTPISKPFELLTNLQVDGPNVESPMMWYYEYRLTNDDGSHGLVKTYHIAFNSGCFHDLSYRIEHIVCIASTPNFSNWDNPGSPRGIRDCNWHRSGTGGMRSGYARTLLKSGDTNATLMAPGGPSIASSNQGGVGDGNVNKEYMVFHGDINEKWFGHENIGYEEQVEKGWERRRGMFVAELDYLGQDDMIKVAGLVKPAGMTETDT